MSKLVIIFGPPAVGKMTIGRSLAKKCGLKFMMNHDTIELLLPHFEWGTPPFERLNSHFRSEIMKEHAQNGTTGIVFTYLWDLNSPIDKKVIDEYKSLFEQNDGEVFFIELFASLDCRLSRNTLPDRLDAKPSKRDITLSEKRLRATEKHKVNSDDDFYYLNENYVKIDNTTLSQNDVIDRVCKHFGW